MNLNEIKPNPNNPRVIKDLSFDRLKKSIENFPQMMELRPMVVDEDGFILGGNMRFEAIKALGYTEIPDNWVVKAEDLTDEQKKEFVIKDNVGFGTWDWELLANEWDELPLTEWGVDVPNLEPLPDLDGFFDDAEQKDEGVTPHRIVLEYTEEEHKLVKDALNKIAATPEQAVWELLGL